MVNFHCKYITYFFHVVFLFKWEGMTRCSFNPQSRISRRLRLASLDFFLLRRKFLLVCESHGVPPTPPPPPPDPKDGGSRHCDGVAHGGEICPSRELEDPLASQQPCPGLLGPSALPLVGSAPGCDLSDPSQWWSREAPLVTRLRPWTQWRPFSLTSNWERGTATSQE